MLSHYSQVGTWSLKNSDNQRVPSLGFSLGYNKTKVVLIFGDVIGGKLQ